VQVKFAPENSELSIIYHSHARAVQCYSASSNKAEEWNVQGEEISRDARPVAISMQMVTSVSFPQSTMTFKLEVQAEANMVLAEPALLEKIDKLFACNVGEYINLPLLVVVGDQSSGKSSVLEGLTKLKFPRNSGLCTRFATQIIFRRDPSLRIRKLSGSIISPTHNDERDNATWSISDVEALNESEFEKMMSEVTLPFSELRV
jgi:hypothetical protein